MPGLTAKRELELLENQADLISETILKIQTPEVREILIKEFDRIIERINILFEILNKEDNPCQD